MSKSTLDLGGDKDYVTRYRHKNGSWQEGPVVRASRYSEAEGAIKNLLAYTQGWHRTNIDVRAKRLDTKSVWPGGIDKEMVR